MEVICINDNWKTNCICGTCKIPPMPKKHETYTVVDVNQEGGIIYFSLLEFNVKQEVFWWNSEHFAEVDGLSTEISEALKANKPSIKKVKEPEPCLV